jgi:hypothetical protein
MARLSLPDVNFLEQLRLTYEGKAHNPILLPRSRWRLIEADMSFESRVAPPSRVCNHTYVVPKTPYCSEKQPSGRFCLDLDWN